MLENSELKEDIRKTALLNAIKHEGKAQTGSVIGKILGEKPDLRSKIKEISTLVDKIVKEVNTLSFDEQKSIVEENWPEALVKEKVEKEKRLPPLPNMDKYRQVVTRFSPNPDCVLHLGSARAIILCYEYAHMYKGKFVLRFEDTDPKIKRPLLEFYDRIREDLAWLGCKPNEEHIQSDRIPIYYEYAEKLLKAGNAYVCTCQPEIFREKALASKSCDCRSLPIEEHLARWHRMQQGGYSEGEAVLRVKTDLNHPNPAVRDWPAARVIDAEKYPHPRVGGKYHVWPLYNLACGIDDHLLGVTHIIRGKEHLTNQVRQEYMYKHLGWKYPEAIHYGRLKITGAYLSKSKIVQGIREGMFKDWDDPRLATFAALRRRGITPEAIKKMIIDIGPKTQDLVLSWENLYAYNRKILDPAANRYFFVQNPIELTVRRIPEEYVVRLNLHPEYPERGFREYAIKPEGNEHAAAFWVSKKDMDPTKIGSMIRLMELFNVKIEKVSSYSAEASFVSNAYEEAKKGKVPLIHWIPVGEDMPCQVVMPDAAMSEGIAEKACKQLKQNTVIQFERFGFVRIDKNNAKLIAYYSQK
ncbi:glutamate--tRNA ligase [Candidatus Bathyarchaeota archaeon RBG_13_46_16b]|nr:MAG: glutamate--tRNA ligase [Candidatus Bathyarchaeota archaeon RBG_13_46_16b]